MSENSNTTNGGIGFTGLLLIAFIVLKLCNVIDWSWWWVLSPAWIPLGICLVCLIVWCAWYLLYKIPDEKKRIASGMNEWAWKHRKNLKPEPKSRWQQRMEEMQAKQKSDKN